MRRGQIMKISSKLTSIFVAGALGLMMTGISLGNTATTYNNMFISYYTPSNVTAMVNYSKDNNLGGLIMWEFRGDAPYDTNDSLLSAAVNAYSSNDTNPSQIMGYWSDWSVYAGGSDRAIPEPAYPVPGSLDSSSGQAVANQDFTDKLEGMNIITYAFLEAQAQTYSYNGQTVTNPNYATDGGTLYFNDPWADLLKQGDDSFCKSADNKICWFVPTMQGKDISSSAMMGNFEAFAKLQHSNTNNPLGALKKVISVGGYGHDDTFEDAFDSQAHINNFVDSTSQIISAYNLDGIDLDYENPNMTHQQSEDFLNLVQALRTKLGNGKLITVTILSSPEYIEGTQNGANGFDAGVLGKISQLADKINLMTYDFHGAFDYNPDGTGTTGFITNLYMPTDSAAGYKFSVDTSVAAAKQVGVDPSKIVVGIPAYGRSLTGIDSTNGGLFQLIPSSTSIPRGDLDNADCDTAISPLGANSCSGSFQYNYIIKNMVGNGFTATERTDDSQSVSNGTTAYANSWTAPDESGYNLELTNTGSSTSGDLGITVDISQASNKFGPSGYLAPSANQTYNKTSNPSTQKIDGKTGLIVHWATYSGGPQGNCPGLLSLNKNMHVMVKVDSQGNGVCYYKPLP